MGILEKDNVKAQFKKTKRPGDSVGSLLEAEGDGGLQLTRWTKRAKSGRDRKLLLSYSWREEQTAQLGWFWPDASSRIRRQTLSKYEEIILV